jgi:hypothetical protein
MRKYRRVVILLVVFLLLLWFSQYPYLVETYYSTGLYPYLALTFRGLFGWVPFSMGDVLYFAVGIALLIPFVRLIKVLFRHQWNGSQWLGWARRLMEWIVVILIVFNLGWALNYSRLGIAYQLDLHPKPYSRDTLQALIDTLIGRTNGSRIALEARYDTGATGEGLPRQVIFRAASVAYGRLEHDFPFLRYRARSVKASLYGELGNYLGFLGYYDPFTGEAQVNCTVPRFTIPYTTCHEMAHQLGYASESEANFVGYLAAVHATDTLFKYSTYFDLFSYANREMYFLDSAAARQNYRALDTLVKKDYKELVLFYRAHRNPLEPLLNRMYDGYLKANHQEKGIESYNEVTGWLIEYQKKYGRL